MRLEYNRITYQLYTFISNWSSISNTICGLQDLQTRCSFLGLFCCTSPSSWMWLLWPLHTGYTHQHTTTAASTTPHMKLKTPLQKDCGKFAWKETVIILIRLNQVRETFFWQIFIFDFMLFCRILQDHWLGFHTQNPRSSSPSTPEISFTFGCGKNWKRRFLLELFCNNINTHSTSWTKNNLRYK